MGEDFEDVVVSIAAAQELAAKYGVRLTAYDATPGTTSAADPVPAAATATPTVKPKK